ncbi:MAG TPA: TonB family protein [Klebsiella sp.]|jgi:TonB family protein
MMTLKLKFLLVIIALMLIFFIPQGVTWFWSAPFRLMDMLSLVPAVLNAPQRLYLYGLWLGGILYFSALMWVSVTRRNKGYLIAAVAQLVFVVGITLFNMPIGEQNQRRWQSMNQLASPVWETFLYDHNTRFTKIILSKPLNQNEILEHFVDHKKPLAEHPLGWNEGDAATADALWQQALGNPEQEAKALPEMADYLTWMVDRSDLTLATAVFTLTTNENKTLAEAAFRRAIAIAPANPDSWLGWAVALIQSRDDERVRSAQFQPLVQSITTGLLMADGLSEGKRQPALQQRLQAYIAQMPPDDRQILKILQARMQARSCASPLAEYVKGEADEVLPLAHSLVFRDAPVRSTSAMNARFPGRVNVEAEKYGVIKETILSMPYPAINKHIKSATTILSLDIHMSGELLNIVVECSSGVEKFDQAALYYAQHWRFHPIPQGQRLLIPVTFISDRLPPEEHYQEMEARAIRIARMAARHNKVGMEAAAKEMLAQFERMKRYYPQKKLSLEEAQNLQLILRKQREKNSAYGVDAFVEVNRAIEALVETHPYFVPLLKILALRTNFGPIDERRAKWAQLLALASDDPQVWQAWGSLWGERDPELYIGAMVYYLQLQSDTKDSGQSIEDIKTRLMMRVGMGDRNSILSAKVYADYADILGEKVKGGDPAKAREILPASDKLDRHEVIAPFDSQVRVSVDIDQKDVVNASLFDVSWKKEQVQGDKRTELTVDVDKNGVPTLVLVSKSSEVELYDAQAVNMLWRWKFKPHPEGRRLTVGMNFGHVKQQLP